MRGFQRSEEHGATVVAVVFIIVIVALLGMASTKMLSGSTESQSDEYQSQQAFHVANAGLAYTAKTLLADTNWSNNADFSKNFSPGTFSITYTSKTPLTATIRSSGTVGGITRSVTQSFTKTGQSWVAFDAAIYTEQDLTDSGQGLATADGDVYAGGVAIASGQGHLDINGDLNTWDGVSVTGQGQINVSGSTAEGYSTTSIPTPDWTYWQNTATHIISGNYTFGGGQGNYTYDGNYYITGSASISAQSNVTINGTVVVLGNFTLTGQSQLAIHPATGQPAIISNNNISLSGQNGTTIDTDGWIFATNTVSLGGQSNFDITGGIIGQNGVTFSGQGALSVAHQQGGGPTTGFSGGEMSGGSVTFGMWSENL